MHGQREDTHNDGRKNNEMNEKRDKPFAGEKQKLEKDLKMMNDMEEKIMRMKEKTE